MLETIMNLDLPKYGMAVLGTAGILGMLTTHLSYRRMLRRTKDEKKGWRGKWTEIWKTRDRLLSRMNHFVWYPSLLSMALFVMAVLMNSGTRNSEGLSLAYIYLGVAIPLILLLFRQGLDFTYREEVMISSLKDYVEWAKGKRADVVEEPDPANSGHVVSRSAIHGQAPDDGVEDALQKEMMIDHIVESVRQTAAAGSHFRNMLTDEEEEIMREVIKEFMS